MPELPEVETVVKTLENQIKDSQIADIKVLYEPIVGNAESFKELIGQHFRLFARRGKYLLFYLDEKLLVAHMRMEGKFYILTDKDPIDKHTHVIFYLADGRQLRYHDVRKFGRMEIRPLDQNLKDFHGLGPEPFDQAFDRAYCRAYLAQRSKPIKEVLLDQSFVAGIGNIYADEICFATHILPTRPASELNDDDCDLLIQATRTILAAAIKQGGTTIRSYTSSLGVTGRFQQELMIHTRQLCGCCNHEVKKIRVGGRGTYYCPVCQK